MDLNICDCKFDDNSVNIHNTEPMYIYAFNVHNKKNLFMIKNIFLCHDYEKNKEIIIRAFSIMSYQKIVIMNNINQSTNELFFNLNVDICDISSRFHRIDNNISAVRHDIINMDDNLSVIKADLLCIKDDDLTIQDDISEIKNNIEEIKSELKDIKYNDNNITVCEKHTLDEIRALTHKVNILDSQIKEIKHIMTDFIDIFKSVSN